MKGAEVFSKVHSEFVPVQEFGMSFIVFFPLENSGCPFPCPSGLHIGQSPDDFDLVRGEGVWTKTNIGLTGSKESFSFNPVSIELVR